jgi:DNA invertase Pin-like site-specific DNA recombinase
VLKDWAKQRDFEVVEVYQETESAWKPGQQKELTKLLSDCRNGRRKFDVVLVWALDRLSREGAAAILNLINAV